MLYTKTIENSNKEKRNICGMEAEKKSLDLSVKTYQCIM